jgi:hypothetical protein
MITTRTPRAIPAVGARSAHSTLDYRGRSTCRFAESIEWVRKRFEIYPSFRKAYALFLLMSVRTASRHRLVHVATHTDSRYPLVDGSWRTAMDDPTDTGAVDPGCARIYQEIWQCFPLGTSRFCADSGKWRCGRRVLLEAGRGRRTVTAPRGASTEARTCGGGRG